MLANQDKNWGLQPSQEHLVYMSFFNKALIRTEYDPFTHQSPGYIRVPVSQASL